MPEPRFHPRFKGNPNTRRAVHLAPEDSAIGKPREEVESPRERRRRLKRERERRQRRLL